MSRGPRLGRSSSLGGWAVVALGVSVWLTPLSAQAFCRAKACDPKQMTCTRDAQGCVQQGPALFWPSNCITLSVQQDGSPAQGISYDAALEVLSDAIATWSRVECEGGGSPSIRAELSEAVECAASESNPDGMNANILVFRDESWPYVGAVDAYGYTRLRFGTETGQLLDADIEINAEMDPFSVGDPVTDVDLASVVTHEVGHLLG
ncbi:MAG TPA: hypothetical protein VJN18_13685, partial [Polyangiaceae bacterium]|nr:hypothetical protein [Polyangiaceae bacterium]